VPVLGPYDGGARQCAIHRLKLRILWQDETMTDEQTPQTDDPVIEGALAAGAPGPGQEPAKENGAKKGSALHDLVDEPAKVMRIGTMVRQLLEEVRSAPLDDAARSRLAEIHERSVKELEDGLAPELIDELERINLPFSDDSVPSDAELRIAQAQLVGWLEGLFHGIQTAIAAQQAATQQMAARLQLRQLPPGTVVAPGVVIGEDGEPRRADGAESENAPAHPRPGQYL
jgi:Protein of unknown function (DUF2587)